MKRLTRENDDDYECRIAGGCPAEDWIESVAGNIYKWNEDPCDSCPFEKYINVLAVYEDEEEGRREEVYL